MNFQEMNKWILSACALFVWGAASVRAQQPVLRFGSDKTFKIAQFTDMHLDPSKPRRLAEAEKTFARLDRILATERPDLVVFTGDVVTGAPAEGMWRRLLDTMTARRVPFCVVLGNHDSEQDLSRQQIGRIVTSYPGSLNALDAAGELADSWELAGEMLARLHRAAADNGWDTIVCCAPEEPGRIEHLLIPGLGLAFVTSRPGMEYGQKPFRRVRLDAMTEPQGKARLRFQTRMAALLREEGAAALKDAKANHDKLEAVYNPYVDFEGVRAQAALEAGRLLSWMK